MSLPMTMPIYSLYMVYAYDDTQLYLSTPPSDAVAAASLLNNDLSRIAAWSVRNCLVLNPSKSKYIVLGTKGQIHSTVQVLAGNDISIMDKPIERVEEAKNLGLLMDGQLRFENHIGKVVSNCFYRLKVLYGIRDYLSTDLRVMLSESLILSRLNYCDVVYGGCILGRTRKLIQRVQNACARFCFKVPPRSHITPYLNNAKLLNMEARRQLHLAKLLFGIVRGRRPIYLYEKLEWSSRARFVHKDRLLFPAHRTMAFRGSFKYAASKCWNNIPPPVREASSRYAFGRQLRVYLLERQKQTIPFQTLRRLD